AFSEQAFKRALEIDPNSIKACLALANLYREGGARAKAEEILKHALEIDPKSVSANQALAGLYIDWRRTNEAEPYLRTAATESKGSNGTLALADFYLGVGRVEDSKAVLEKLDATNPTAFVAVRTRLGVIEYVTGHREEGHRLLNEAVAKYPKDPIA